MFFLVMSRYGYQDMSRYMSRYVKIGKLSCDSLRSDKITAQEETMVLRYSVSFMVKGVRNESDIAEQSECYQ